MEARCCRCQRSRDDAVATLVALIRSALADMQVVTDWRDAVDQHATATLLKISTARLANRVSDGIPPIGCRMGKHRWFTVQEIAEAIADEELGA